MEAQQVIQMKEMEKNNLKNEAQLDLNLKDQQAAAIQQCKIEIELESNQDKGKIALTNRNFEKYADDIKMQMHAEYEKRSEDMLAQNQRPLQSQALVESRKLEAHQQQKEYANWQESQRRSAAAMNM